MQCVLLTRYPNGLTCRTRYNNPLQDMLAFNWSLDLERILGEKDKQSKAKASSSSQAGRRLAIDKCSSNSVQLVSMMSVFPA